MKLTCDLCGGELQMNAGGQGATCANCGLGYTMDRLREKLTGASPVPPEPPKPEPPKPEPPKPEEKIYNVTQWEPANPPKPEEKVYNVTQWEPANPPKPEEKIYNVTQWKPANPPKRSFDYVPQQFVMENTGNGNGGICGRVQQGGIGLGDHVYIDGDYAHPYKVYSINDDPYMISAKQGMPTELYLVKCPRKVWKNARMVTGITNPVANAYNYPGTVGEYFSHLLLGTFGEYEIIRDDEDIPVSYLFCKNDKPVLAVFLIHSNDGKGRTQVRKAARIFALEGVACTYFYENYRNDAPYVIDRIKGALPEAGNIGVSSQHNEPVAAPQPEPIILEVKSVKTRPGFAWGNANCMVQQGTVECGMPYYAHINTLEGGCIQVGSLKPTDAPEGSDVKMLLYCDKELLSTIKMLYVFPEEECDDGDEA